jgi:hypothetical protein
VPCEVRLRNPSGKDVGQVDLAFRDENRTFCLLVELKLHSTYGLEQLPRYLEGLLAEQADRKALIAVTTATPQAGEDNIAHPDLWLGSIRWSRAFEQLVELPHSDPPTGLVWRALMALMRHQGDFGPMDVDEDAVRAWALRDEAERHMRHWLADLVQVIVGGLQAQSGSSLAQAARVLRPFVPWKGQVHAKIAVPGDIAEERLRVQFWANERITFFDVEARYEHPMEAIDEDPRLDAITAALEAAGFEFGSDGLGWYWAKWFDPSEWLCGADTLQRLLEITTETTQQLVASGLFATLATLEPTTPAQTSEEGMGDEPAS